MSKTLAPLVAAAAFALAFSAQPSTARDSGGHHGTAEVAATITDITAMAGTEVTAAAGASTAVVEDIGAAEAARSSSEVVARRSTAGAGRPASISAATARAARPLAG